MTTRRSPRPYNGDPSRRGEPRLLLLQCQLCNAVASGRVVGRRLLSSNLPVYFERGTPTHRDCGGTFRAVDLPVMADA